MNAKTIGFGSWGMRTVALAASALAASAGTTYGSMAAYLTYTGDLYKFDTTTNAPATLIANVNPGSTASGVAIDSSGTAWSLGWSGGMRSVNLNTLAVSGLRTLPRPAGISSGFYKDLAWDYANNRLLALYWTGGTSTSAVIIGVVNTDAMTFTSLGPITGVPSGNHVTGMAVSSTGAITLGDNGPGRAWDLSPTPGGGFSVSVRSVLTRILYFEGMDYDPSDDALYVSAPFGRVSADGSVTVLRSDISGSDIAFYPLGVPAPGAASTLVIGAALTSRRRRTQA